MKKITPEVIESLKETLLRMLLSSNRENPVCADEIVSKLRKKFPQRDYPGISIHPAKVRSMVAEFRKNHIPVIANNKGYFISYNDEDIAEEIVSLENRIKSIQGSIDGLKYIFTIKELDI